MPKPNHYQSQVLARIEAGDVEVTGPQCSQPKLTVVAFQSSRDGFDWLAHRTIRKPESECGPDERLNYRTQIFRILHDSVVKRI